MKIIADENIPYLDVFFADWGDITLLPAMAMTATALQSADMLLVRTVTQVNATLLTDSSVQFIGSTTAGMDHLDTAWLDQQKIHWAYAAGCNANAVANYVLACLAAISKDNLISNKEKRVGVIGVGHVGQQVCAYLQNFGYDIVQNDPPRADNEAEFISQSLDEILQCPIITIHTPLTHNGAYPSYNLLDSAAIAKLAPGTVLINTSRGGVIDTSAALARGGLITCIDVWENEPTVDCTHIQAATIATPHIAGYSRLAKFNATQQIYRQACQFFGKSEQQFLPPDNALTTLQHWQDALTIFDPAQLSEQFKSAANFTQFRQAYQHRLEFRLAD